LPELVGNSAREGLLDANEIAKRHGVSREFVYEHADELGAVRLGTGPRPRLRFNPAAVAERLAAISAAGSSSTDSRLERTPATRRKRAAAPDRRLLPIRDARREDSPRKRA
jgi:hypothetical protein